MLPKIDVPVYTIKLLSSGKTLQYRPFTVKEEKLFLMASESEEMDTIVDTIKQVINNCVLDECDVNDLPMFDIEHIFLNIRARSIGENINLRYNCNNIISKEGKEDKKCNNIVSIDLNILEVKPEKEEGHTNKIEITDSLGLVMSYPSINILKEFNMENQSDSIMDMTVSCIDYIYDKDSIYYAKDTPKQELVDFLESMQSKDLEKIRNFFDTMPKMKKTIHFKCDKCEHEENIELEGIQNFFV
jgi:hypothetical protein